MAIFKKNGMEYDIDPMFQAVFPIIHFKNRNISIAGTSILVGDNEEPFLLTAAHVLRGPGKDYPLYILLPENNGHNAIRLHEPAFMTQMPNEQSITDLDIACFPLNYHPTLLKYLNGYKILPLREFDGSIEYAREHYFICGFPCSKAKYSRKDKEFRAKPLRYYTDLVADETQYAKYNRPKDKYILVKYKPKESKKMLTGEMQIAPQPYGISGGPLFRALVDKSNFLLLYIFEGLLIEWKGTQVIVATKKSQIRNFIDCFYRQTPVGYASF